MRTDRSVIRPRRHRGACTPVHEGIPVPAGGWNRDGNCSSSRLRVRRKGRSRRTPLSPPIRSGTLRIDACGDYAPCVDCRRKPTVRQKKRRGTERPHPQRARRREQDGVVHRSAFQFRSLARRRSSEPETTDREHDQFGTDEDRRVVARHIACEATVRPQRRDRKRDSQNPPMPTRGTHRQGTRPTAAPARLRSNRSHPSPRDGRPGDPPLNSPGPLGAVRPPRTATRHRE